MSAPPSPNNRKEKLLLHWPMLLHTQKGLTAVLLLSPFQPFVFAWLLKIAPIKSDLIRSAYVCVSPYGFLHNKRASGIFN